MQINSEIAVHPSAKNFGIQPSLQRVIGVIPMSMNRTLFQPALDPHFSLSS